MTLKRQNITKVTNRKSHSGGEILGIALSGTTTERVLSSVRANLESRHKFIIITPYAEMMMLTQKDPGFRDIVNSADILVSDGVGLAASHKFLSLPNPSSKLARLFVLPLQGLVVGLSVLVAKDWLTKDFEIVRGRELFWDVLGLANKKAWKVFFFGSDDPEVGVKLQKQIAQSMKKIKTASAPAPFVSAVDGRPILQTDKELEKRAIIAINKFKPHILFIGMTPPKQEKWFMRNKNKLNVGGAMALGATLDIAVGRFAKSPELVARLGLEWFWRLLTGTKSFRRVWSAFPMFPLAVFRQKLLE